MNTEVTFTITFLKQRKPPYINFQNLKDRKCLSLKTNIKIINTLENESHLTRSLHVRVLSFLLSQILGVPGSVDVVPFICCWGMPVL